MGSANKIRTFNFTIIITNINIAIKVITLKFTANYVGNSVTPYLTSTKFISA